ncbi:uncharacterized protein PMUG01_11015500 [Plasmodium malariae]|uniref:Uncharacterized protein n=2 Tax=Plasmodium (Plasmodium) TaxID=418103 RepID=A0A1A8X226_PLAMA|nr:uncharacterized protein PMUG01_11015500 [Plasmodium malariae]SBS99294.1 hypothetical protein PMALA_068960 [Plasmodium malariae]SCO92910.1 hypothetical protein PMUG01_11015500 [Plasmodium malariae]
MEAYSTIEDNTLSRHNADSQTKYDLEVESEALESYYGPESDSPETYNELDIDELQNSGMEVDEEVDTLDISNTESFSMENGIGEDMDHGVSADDEPMNFDVTDTNAVINNDVLLTDIFGKDILIK